MQRRRNFGGSASKAARCPLPSFAIPTDSVIAAKAAIAKDVATPAHAAIATDSVTPADIVIPAHAAIATDVVIPAHAAIATDVVIPAHAAVPTDVVIPAQAGIHAGACCRRRRRDFVLPAPRQSLPGVDSHCGGRCCARLPCGARPGVASRNSLRSLRSLRSDNRDESDDEARCARRPLGCAPRHP